MSDEFEFIKNDMPLTNWRELAFVGDPDEPDHQELAAIQAELQAALDDSVTRVKEAS